MMHTTLWTAAGVAGSLLFAVPFVDLLVGLDDGSLMHAVTGTLGLALLAIAAAYHVR
jgi:hypothetical protein